MRKPGVGLILLIIALFNFSFNGVNSVTGVLIKDKFAASPLTLGLLFVFVGIATALVQGVLIESSVSRYGEKRMALIGLLASVIGWKVSSPHGTLKQPSNPWFRMATVSLTRCTSSRMWVE